MEKLSKAELNFLINAHDQFDPRHIFGEMMRDRWGINYPGTEISEYITGPSRSMSKADFKKAYREMRRYLSDDNDCDPAGGYGLHSHE